MKNQAIEREIVIGLITSTEYCVKIKSVWESKYIVSETAKKISKWCWEYYNQYKKAPQSQIESLYIKKIQADYLSEEDALWLETVLDNLSASFEVTEDFNISYLIDNTKDYFKARKLHITKSELDLRLSNGNVEEAEKILLDYSPIKEDAVNELSVFDGSEKTRIALEKSFNTKKHSLVKYPGALGQFWNHSMNKGDFVAFMGKAKIGKSNILLDVVFAALRCRKKVALFQAGDMNEVQQLRRIAIGLAGKSDREKYCGHMYAPVLDCQYNQLDTCNSADRQCAFGIFHNIEEAADFDSLRTAFKDYPEYQACRNCKELKGSPWLREMVPTFPLTYEESLDHFAKFKKRYKDTLKLSTHASKTLSLQKMKSILKGWRDEGFIPDLVAVDYVDIMATDPRIPHKDQQNENWLGLRNISQDIELDTPMVATVTQVASTVYNKILIEEEDFAQDKRKYDHVTSMYGLNQTPEEKQIGIMRINEIVNRESDFDMTRPVTILQKIAIGKPIINSYY